MLRDAVRRFVGVGKFRERWGVNAREQIHALLYASKQPSPRGYCGCFGIGASNVSTPFVNCSHGTYPFGTISVTAHLLHRRRIFEFVCESRGAKPRTAPDGSLESASKCHGI